MRPFFSLKAMSDFPGLTSQRNGCIPGVGRENSVGEAEISNCDEITKSPSSTVRYRGSQRVERGREGGRDRGK